MPGPKHRIRKQNELTLKYHVITVIHRPYDGDDDEEEEHDLAIMTAMMMIIDVTMMTMII